MKTDLGGADLEVEVGVTELKKIILESEKTENGKFLNISCSWAGKTWCQYDGKEIPCDRRGVMPQLCFEIEIDCEQPYARLSK